MTFAKNSTAAAILSVAFTLSPFVYASDEGSAEVDNTRRATMLAELTQSGSELYAERDYRHAVEKFLQAYAIEADPNLLFNIARCYHALGDSAGAIEKYRQFLASPGADSEGKRRAQEGLDSLLEEQRRASSPEPVSARPPAGAPSQEKAAPVTAAPAESSDSFGALPWITLATGGAATVVGTILYAGGVSDHKQVTGARGFGQSGSVVDMSRAEAETLVDSGNSKKTLGGITLGVGGALVATSVVLFLTDGPSSDAPRDQIALAASPLKGGASLSFSGRF